MTIPKHSLKTSTLTTILLYLLLGVTAQIYWAGLPGTFLLDDFHHLETLNTYGGVTNLQTLMNFVFGQSSGPTGRPVSMISFLLNDQYWPGSVTNYKITNIKLHLLSGVLIFFLLYKINKNLSLPEEKSQYIALASTGLWLLHPLNVSTTLYVIQRMTILMTLFCLAALIVYLYLRQTDLRQQWLKATLLSFLFVSFGLLSVLSKENGVLLLLFVLTIEFTIPYKKTNIRHHQYWLLIFIILPLIIIVTYFIYTWGDILDAYSVRNFTLLERLLTESRILISYLGEIIFPQNAGTGIFHDDISISTGLFTPITTILSIFSISFLLYTAFAFRKKHSVYSFAVLWYFSAHILESTFLSLELYFEHRNYMAMIGPLFAIIFYIYNALTIVKKRLIKQLLNILPIIMLLLFGAITYQSTSLWGNPLSLFSIWAYENPKSIRSQLLYARQLDAFGEHNKAINVLTKTLEIYPNDITLPLHIIDLSCNHNIPLKIDIKDMTDINSQSIYRGSTLTPLKNIVKQYVNNKCTQLLSTLSLHDYMNKLVTVPEIANNPNDTAAIYYLHADYYVSEKLLSPAIKLLDKAFKLQPTVDIALRQTVLLYSAGLYEEAYVYLKKAIHANNTRKIFTSSRETELNILKKDILIQLSK